MAVKATIFKAELQISDMDRNYYQMHALTLAQHPSETEERLMVRLLAFALNASDSLAFGRGISTDDEPDLWQKDLTGVIDRWIEIGQPDEQRIRKACGRAGQVLLYTFSGRSAAIWWEKNSAALERCRNLSVIDVPAETSQAIARLASRNMQLQCFVQDGHVQLMNDTDTVQIELNVLKGAAATR
ncbi:MAG: YaeQ family protein [Arenimonas sp.]|jgi:uncharacterized protein YaeQ